MAASIQLPQTCNLKRELLLNLIASIADCCQQTSIMHLICGVRSLQKTPSLQVVSFGVGTKFMSERGIQEDTTGSCLRDCHAEVLARKAFIRFLYQQVLSAQAEVSCNSHGCGSENPSVSAADDSASAAKSDRESASLQVCCRRQKKKFPSVSYLNTTTHSTQFSSQSQTETPLPADPEAMWQRIFRMAGEIQCAHVLQCNAMRQCNHSPVGQRQD